MIEGELDYHLDYDRNQKSKSGNTRNGFSQKKVRSSFGEEQIQVPKTRIFIKQIVTIGLNELLL